MTKFSVLLPTRDRLEYLQQAVASVYAQDEEDWEICIADNASSDLTSEWVRDLGDARVLYHRSEDVLPVTENWNRSLSMSSGDYVVMLGDDDALLRGYFTSQQKVIDTFGRPEAIYAKGLLFSYPGVIPGRPSGSLQACGVAEFMAGEVAPTLMTRQERDRAVDDAFAFLMSYPFNMQLVLLSRDLIERLGTTSFFRSPYPDYFAMNRIFLEANDVVKVPRPLVAVGATVKSFGYFYFNGAVSTGVEFLGNRSVLDASARTKRLGGTEHLDSWRLALEALSALHPQLRTKLNYRRYRRMQFGNLLRQPRSEGTHLPGLSSNFWVEYPVAERLLLSAVGAIAEGMIRISPRRLRPHVRRAIARAGRELARETAWRAQPELVSGLKSMSEVVARVSLPDSASSSAAGLSPVGDPVPGAKQP